MQLKQLNFHSRGIPHFSVHVHINYCNYAGLSYVKMMEEEQKEDEMYQDYKPGFEHLLPSLLQGV